MAKKILLLTVANYIEAIQGTISKLKPDLAIFFCSENYREKVIKEWFSQKVCRYELTVIQHPDDLNECYQLVSDTIKTVKKDHPDSEIIADYTGGTKTMSLGLALASLESGLTLQVNSVVSLSTVTHPFLQLSFLENIQKTLPTKPTGNAIKTYTIGNFKAFSHNQNISLRPLTLIFGANSSGKSSIIHSLLLAHHAINNKGELDVYRTEAGGDSVDLGGFSQYVHRRDNSKLVEWQIEINPKHLNLVELGLNDLLGEAKSITVGVGIGRGTLGDEKIKLRSFSLSIEEKTLLTMSSRPQNKLQLDRLDYSHPIVKKIIDAIIQTQSFKLKITPQDEQKIKTVINELVPTITAQTSHLFPDKIIVEKEVKTQDFSKKITNLDLVSAIQLTLPRQLENILRAVSNAIETDLGKFRYLGPFRTYPPRHFAFSHQQDSNWYAGGGYAWDILLNNEKVREKVNKWLGDSEKMNAPYELVVRGLLPDWLLSREIYPRIDRILQDLTTRLIAHGASWGDEIQGEIERMMADFSAFGIGENDNDSVLPEVEQLVSIYFEDTETIAEEWIKEIKEKGDRISDLILIDKRSKTPVSHRDVGIGVSQVIPVLVSCYGLSDALIAIEQPEIHLHPKLQAELGSVLAESIKPPYNNRFILETHSEHIMLRIQKLIREGDLKPEQVSVVYVDCDQDGSTCLQLRLDEEGDFIDEWPEGFFEEDFNEIF
jgi:CRISPR-associated protein (Cas_Cas02710)/AAA ATPase domain/Protein of unknown function (DUF3696)